MQEKKYVDLFRKNAFLKKAHATLRYLNLT